MFLFLLYSDRQMLPLFSIEGILWHLANNKQTIIVKKKCKLMYSAQIKGKKREV